VCLLRIRLVHNSQVVSAGGLQLIVAHDFLYESHGTAVTKKVRCGRVPDDVFWSVHQLNNSLSKKSKAISMITLLAS
jgi:hypothetical protein